LFSEAYELFMKAWDCCRMKRKAPDIQQHEVKRRKFSHQIPISWHSCKSTKQSFDSGSIAPADHLLLRLALPEQQPGPDVLMERVDVLERVTAYAKSRLEVLEASSKPIQHKLESPCGYALDVPHLSAEATEEVFGYWNDFKSDDVLCIINKAPIKRTDLRTLKPPNWLNDEVVNASAALMPVLPHIMIMNSFFFETISQEYVRESINVPKLKRILSRRGFNDSITKLLVPINIKKTHWICAEVDFVNNAVITYDSLGANPMPGTALAVVLGKYLGKEFSIRVGKSPLQENGHDCGVFMTANLSLLAQNLPLEYSQHLLKDFRKVIAVRILRQKWNIQ